MSCGDTVCCRSGARSIAFNATLGLLHLLYGASVIEDLQSQVVQISILVTYPRG